MHLAMRIFLLHRAHPFAIPSHPINPIHSHPHIPSTHILTPNPHPGPPIRSPLPTRPGNVAVPNIYREHIKSVYSCVGETASASAASIHGGRVQTKSPSQLVRKHPPTSAPIPSHRNIHIRDPIMLRQPQPVAVNGIESAPIYCACTGHLDAKLLTGSLDCWMVGELGWSGGLAGCSAYCSPVSVGV